MRTTKPLGGTLYHMQFSLRCVVRAVWCVVFVILILERLNAYNKATGGHSVPRAILFEVWCVWCGPVGSTPSGLYAIQAQDQTQHHTHHTPHTHHTQSCHTVIMSPAQLKQSKNNITLHQTTKNDGSWVTRNTS